MESDLNGVFEWDGTFEWDEGKSLVNFVKHRVDFRKARELFDDVERTTEPVIRPGEPRFRTVAEMDGGVYAAIWTPRGGSFGSSPSGGQEMQKSERIVRYTDEELREMLRRGEDETDYAYLDAMTEEELESSIDHDEEGEGSGVFLRGFPQMKREVTLRIDSDLIDWFDDPDMGPGPRINAVLRGYVESQRWEEWAKRRADDARARKGEAA